MRASFFCIFCLFACLCPSFLPCHPPPPSFIFWLSFHLSRGQNRKSRSSVFFCSETKRKHLLRRLFVSYFNWESLLVQHEFVLNFLSTRRLLEHTRASTQCHDSVVTICTITNTRKLTVFFPYNFHFQTGVCTHRFTFDGRVMCLHAAFDLLFVGLNTGIVASIDLLVSVATRWTRRGC